MITLFCCKFNSGSNSENILKIGQHLLKLWQKLRSSLFLTHSVYILTDWHAVMLKSAELISREVNATKYRAGQLRSESAQQEIDIDDIVTRLERLEERAEEDSKYIHDVRITCLFRKMVARWRCC